MARLDALSPHQPPGAFSGAPTDRARQGATLLTTSIRFRPSGGCPAPYRPLDRMGSPEPAFLFGDCTPPRGSGLVGGSVRTIYSKSPRACDGEGSGGTPSHNNCVQKTGGNLRADPVSWTAAIMTTDLGHMGIVLVMFKGPAKLLNEPFWHCRKSADGTQTRPGGLKKKISTKFLYFGASSDPCARTPVSRRPAFGSALQWPA
jgi:hypothetical protein